MLNYRKHHGLTGLWLNVALVTIADAVLTLKWLLRRRTLRGAMPFWTHAATTWSLLQRTAWATRPTR